jgi:hypothetical protein
MGQLDPVFLGHEIPDSALMAPSGIPGLDSGESNGPYIVTHLERGAKPRLTTNAVQDLKIVSPGFGRCIERAETHYRIDLAHKCESQAVEKSIKAMSPNVLGFRRAVASRAAQRLLTRVGMRRRPRCHSKTTSATSAVRRAFRPAERNTGCYLAFCNQGPECSL